MHVGQEKNLYLCETVQKPKLFQKRRANEVWLHMALHMSIRFFGAWQVQTPVDSDHMIKAFIAYRPMDSLVLVTC